MSELTETQRAQLTKDLKRWPEMTAAEKNALVAVQVKGWKYYLPYNSWVDKHGDHRSADNWNPTTDAKDTREAVGAYMESGGSTTVAMSYLVTGAAYQIPSREAFELLSARPLKDICKALLQALAECEGNDGDD